MHVMVDQLVSNLQRRESIELLMMDTNKANPLLTALPNRILQSLGTAWNLSYVSRASILTVPAIGRIYTIV